MQNLMHKIAQVGYPSKRMARMPMMMVYCSKEFILYKTLKMEKCYTWPIYLMLMLLSGSQSTSFRADSQVFINPLVVSSSIPGFTGTV